jgi:hypothetical protein
MNAEPPSEPRPEPSLPRVLLVAPLLTAGFAILSLIFTMSVVPRRTEGIRDVPDISWPAYAMIGNLIPIMCSILVLGFIFRGARDRIIAWMIAALFCYIAHETFLTNLLRRDFIGKF